jgi:hypothetical protein
MLQLVQARAAVQSAAGLACAFPPNVAQVLLPGGAETPIPTS